MEKNLSMVLYRMQDNLLRMPPIMCLNDNRGKGTSTEAILEAATNAYYDVLFPYPSSFEKDGYCPNTNYFTEYLREKLKIFRFVKKMLPVIRKHKDYLS